MTITLKGRVVHGDKRGRVLGFPTANLNARTDMAYGVYASQTRIAGSVRLWPSVTSYGTRPTFDGADQRIETHVLDFAGDLYGQEIEVTLLAFIRAEARFDSAEALIAAMRRDIAEARAMIGPGDQGAM